MAKLNYTIKVTELEPFKNFYDRISSHINDYQRDFCSASEAMYFIMQDFIFLKETLGKDDE